VNHLSPFLHIDAVAGTRSVDFPFDEPNLTELLEVLGDGRLREGQYFHNFAADATFSCGERFKDGDPRRMGEDVGERRYFRLPCIETVLLAESHIDSLIVYRKYTIEVSIMQAKNYLD